MTPCPLRLRNHQEKDPLVQELLNFAMQNQVAGAVFCRLFWPEIEGLWVCSEINWHEVGSDMDNAASRELPINRYTWSQIWRQIQTKVYHQVRVASNSYASGHAIPDPEDVFYLASKPLTKLQAWMACMTRESKVCELSIYRHLLKYESIVVRFGYLDWRSDIYEIQRITNDGVYVGTGTATLTDRFLCTDGFTVDIGWLYIAIFLYQKLDSVLLSLSKMGIDGLIDKILCFATDKNYEPAIMYIGQPL
jgi:hypothetical protein